MTQQASESPIYSFRAIRTALLNAAPRSPTFPFGTSFEGEPLQQLRTRPHLQPFLGEMRAEAERAVASAPPALPFHSFRLFEASGDRSEYEAAYFERRRRLLALALASVIDQTDKYLAATMDIIWAICNEYTWALPAHLPVGITAVTVHWVPPEQVVDLFAAHTAHGLAEVLVLLRDRLDPWFNYRIRSEIERRIFQPVFHDPRHFAWESAPMNWASVCGGCAGMAALILEDDRERLAGMIERVVRTMECFLEGFGDDGGCPEGIGYWQYGFGFYVYFAEMLADYTGGALDMLRGDKIQRIIAFPHAITLADGNYVNYSDAPARVNMKPGLGSRLAKRSQKPLPALREPSFHSDHAYRLGHVVRNLLWTDPAQLHAAAADGTSYLPDLAWLISRTIIAGSMVAFSAKGGHNDEPHNHNDLGHFLLHIGGESLLTDLGSGLYTRQYFGPERYTDLHTGSHGHSVPIIGGQTQHAGAESRANVVAYSQHENGLVYALDLSSAYDLVGLRSFVRSFSWRVDSQTQSGYLELTDSFDFSQPIMVEECFVSGHAPLLAANSVTWPGQHGSVTLRFAAEHWTAALDTLPITSHQGAAITVYRVRLQQRSAAAALQAQFSFECRLA